MYGRDQMTKSHHLPPACQSKLMQAAMTVVNEHGILESDRVTAVQVSSRWTFRHRVSGAVRGLRVPHTLQKHWSHSNRARPTVGVDEGAVIAPCAGKRPVSLEYVLQDWLELDVVL